MTEQFIGEIRIFSFGFIPRGWAQCAGQLLPINQNQALFALLGTMYGGNGQTTFALPDLRGRVPVHLFSNSYPQGETGGESAHTLTMSEMPAHTHQVAAAQPFDPGHPQVSPSGATWGSLAATAFAPTPDAAMAAASVTPVGGSQPHENMPPYLVLSYCIATQGIFPSPEF